MDVITPGFSPHFVDYERGLALQRTIHDEVARGDRDNTLLLLEHEAVYTAGKRTEAGEHPSDGTPVIPVDRGGKITWHGPGQLVGYPIVVLEEPMDVVAYVRELEQIIIDVLTDFGVRCQRVAGRSGVWFDNNGYFEKLAAIGIRVADRVTSHGFAINVSNDTAAFEQIVACGIRDAGTTTVSRVLGRTLTPAELAPAISTRCQARWAQKKVLA